MRKPVLAVDFDGTITRENCYPACLELMPGAVESLNLLHELGCTIILWTCRSGKYLEDAKQYCRDNGIPFDYANENTREALTMFGGNDCRKIFADYYIDDRNIDGFPGWNMVYARIYYDMFYTEGESAG